MTPTEIRTNLADYERLAGEEILWQTVLSSPVKCSLIGSVQLNGAQLDYKLNAPDSIVLARAQNRLTTVQADKLALKTLLGITP